MREKCGKMKDFYSEKRNGVYHFRFRNPGTGEFDTSRSSGLRNRDAAIAWATLEYEKIRAKAGSSASPFMDWAERFFKDGCPHIERVRNEGRSYSEKTRFDNRRYVEFLIEDKIGEIAMNDLRRSDILDLQARIVKKFGRTRTAQKVYGAFHIILAEAIFRGLLQLDPSTGIKKIAYKKTPRKAMTKDDLDKFLDPTNWPNLTHWKMTMTARYAGLRAGEVRALTWESLDAKENIMKVEANLPGMSSAVTDPKWGKKRRAPYPKALREILEPGRSTGLVFRDGDGPVKYWDWHDSVVAARTKAGVSAGIHALRHTINTQLAEAGVSRELRKAMFGWASDQVEDGYTHYDMMEIAPLGKIIDATSSKKAPKKRGESADTAQNRPDAPEVATPGDR